jgi:hypothetical protein
MNAAKPEQKIINQESGVALAVVETMYAAKQEQKAINRKKQELAAVSRVAETK